MSEKVILEFLAIIAGLVWLLKLSLTQWNFKKNHLSEISERLARIEERLKSAENDIKCLYDRFNNYINGKSK